MFKLYMLYLYYIYNLLKNLIWAIINIKNYNFFNIILLNEKLIIVKNDMNMLHLLFKIENMNI